MTTALRCGCFGVQFSPRIASCWNVILTTPLQRPRTSPQLTQLVTVQQQDEQPACNQVGCGFLSSPEEQEDHLYKLVLA